MSDSQVTEQPSNNSLQKVLGQADRVLFLLPGDRCGLEAREPRCISELVEAFSFDERPVTFYDRSRDDAKVRFEFYRQGQSLADLEVHYRVTIRCCLWSEYLGLLDGFKHLRWLAERGVSGPLRRYEEALAAQNEELDPTRGWT